MGVPAFFRWLSEKYPKCLQDVLEVRVGDDGRPLEQWGKTPHPNSRLPGYADVECDNLYIDMNGIIHPCAHPEHGPQPETEEQMYVNVCAAVDRLCRVLRPRKTLFLAIDGVAPRAKMNQQRARRFRSAQEARELAELEATVRVEISQDDTADNAPPPAAKKAWDSNVITPGTHFMLGLAMYVRFYIRQRLSTDPNWRHLQVLFSDASVPGEGEHKIMQHVRLQRSQPGYNPNVVHVLHGLDADLIMLALATHEAHFYISREEVLFGRKSVEMQERRQQESGFADLQRQLDTTAGDMAMQLDANRQKPLQRVSIPILREYLQAEFATVLTQIQPPPSLERLIDDFVFLCFFVGNDFLPHLPSLDIRDGALDFLLNVYKSVLPTLGSGNYLTLPGGNLNLPAINTILQHVGAVEDYVFEMQHSNEARRRAERESRKGSKKGPKAPPADGSVTVDPQYKVQGRAARILGKHKPGGATTTTAVKPPARPTAKPMLQVDNSQAALALKQALLGGGRGGNDDSTAPKQTDDDKGPKITSETENDEAATEAAIAEDGDNGNGKDSEAAKEETSSSSPSKRKASEIENGVGQVGDIRDEFDADEEEDDEDDADDDDKPPEPEIVVPVDPEVAKAFKEKVMARQQKKLDEYAQNVVDNVRLHEPGWKDRYYSDKCKADDVAENGGKEHLFRTYVMGLVWVMKYYYDGCPSWKFYYPFHYAPFASDLQNIERFAKDIKSFQLGKPFNPVEQLMAVLPSDSVHAIPKAARWLMTDPESPILDFYPKDVPVDPNGKAMPWLWVVLLPFIDEGRLLPALSSTIPKWNKLELLCNVRGLDDAYLYVHTSHPLCPKLSTVLREGRTAKDPKIRLNDAAAYGCGGFSGSLRPPLENELYPVDRDDIRISPPPTAEKISDPLPDGLFLEDIEPNLAVCVSFTEPIKLPHKSILLPGAKPPDPILTDEDKRIRRPRINRGATIANMGVSNGKSFQSGYGSMNISSYERELAAQTGRGAQMNQAGTRSWGSMEPSFKRPRVNPNPFQQQQKPPMQGQQWQPSMAQGTGYPPQGYPAQQQQQQRQQQHPTYGGNGWGQPQNTQYGQRPPYQRPPPVYQQQQPQRQQSPYSQAQQRQGYPGRGGMPPGQYHQGQRQQQHQQHRAPPHPSARVGRGPPPPPPRQDFSFRQGPGSGAPPQRSRTSAEAMRSLREQLSSTLQQNRRQQG